MPRAFRSRFGVLLLLLLLALALLFLNPEGPLSPLQDAAFGILRPVQTLLRELGRSVQGLFSETQDLGTLRAQVEALTEEVNRLTIDQVRLHELEIENTQLREQLAYVQGNPDYVLVGGAVLAQNPDAARVLGQDPSNLTNYILIDQGRAEGVAVGMPVVTPVGLVGSVTEVGQHWAKALLILDPTSAVNVVIQSSRATGVLQGQLNADPVIKYLPQGEIVKKGDLVLTSGIGGKFPKRLVVGQVDSVRQRDIDLFQEAVVKTSVDFNRLEFVLIVKNFTPQDITQEPTPTPTPRPTPTRTPTPTPTPRR